MEKTTTFKKFDDRLKAFALSEQIKIYGTLSVMFVILTLLIYASPLTSAPLEAIATAHTLTFVTAAPLLIYRFEKLMGRLSAYFVGVLAFVAWVANLLTIYVV